jgi:hypothetical protein
MAATLAIGFLVGTWFSENGGYASLATSDTRPRAPTGDARLLMDHNFEHLRPGPRDRAKAPAPGPVQGVQPARMTAPPAQQIPKPEEG